MKTLSLIIIAFLSLFNTLLAIGEPYSKENNLIKNPGFEDGTWTKIGKVVDEAHSGKKAFFLEFGDKTAVSSKVTINPKMDHYFSIWLKGKDLKKAIGTAVVKICSKNGRAIPNPLKEKGAIVLGQYQGEVIYVTGNGDWKNYVLYFPATEIPDEVTQASIQLFIRRLSKKGFSGGALFDDVYFGPADLTLDLKVVSNGKEEPAFFADLGADAHLDLGVYMPGKKGKTVKGTIQITDYFGNVVKEKKVADALGDDSGVRYQLPIKDLPIGYYLAELEVPGYPVQKKAFGILDPKLKTTETDYASPYGINIRAFYSPLVFDIFQRLGFKWFRGGPNTARWSSVEPEKGTFKFDHVLKERAFLKKYGFLRIERMQSYPKWAQQQLEGGKSARGGRQYRDRASRSFPADVEGWKKYCEETARALSVDGPSQFELWNEPAGTNNWMDSNEKFIELVKITHDAIKKGHPESSSVMCGLQGVGEPGEQDKPYPSKDEVWRQVNFRKFFNMLMAAGESMDILNFHSYGGYMNLHTKLGAIKESEKKYPFLKGKEIWITETGNNTGSQKIPERRHAQVYVKTHAVARSYGNVKVFWFSGINSGRDLAYNEHNFGMMHCDLMPKPSVFAHTALVGILGKGKIDKQLSLGEGVTAYKYRTENGPVSIVWTEEPELVAMALDTPMQMKNIMGNPVPPVKWGEMYLVDLSQNPVYIFNEKLEGTNRGQVIKPVNFVAAKGKSAEGTITFLNPSQQEIISKVRLLCPKGCLAKPATLDLSIPAGGKVSKTITVTNQSVDELGLHPIKIEIQGSRRPLECGLNLEVPLPEKAYTLDNGQLTSDEIKPGMLAYRITPVPGMTDTKMILRRNFEAPYQKYFKMTFKAKATGEKSSLVFSMTGNGSIQFSVGLGAHKVKAKGAIVEDKTDRIKAKAGAVITYEMFVDLQKRAGYFSWGKEKQRFELKPSFDKVSGITFAGKSEYYVTEPVIVAE